MRRVFLYGPAVAAMLTAASACGGSGSGPSAPSNAGGDVVTITVIRQNGAQSFSPNPAAAGGRNVVFRNADSIVHRVRLNDGTIDTGDIAPGATSAAFRMPSTGTNYHCTLHPTMVGAVSGASGEAPPACEGPYCGEGGVNY